ncbi:MAG TPA: type II toxin-antitoxin system RelE/ParE family toxin [Conexibacter sp.]|jgi:mRNA interferase RelE/StbE
MPAGDLRPWRLAIANRATKDLRNLDPPIRERILDALDALQGEAPRGDLRPLVGREDEARLRVGDWRVILKRDEAERIIYVRRVLPRGRAYDR